MPIDGITFIHPLENFTDYRKAVPFLKWATPRDARTGEPVTTLNRKDKAGRYHYSTLTHTAEYEGLFLKAKEIFRTAEPGNIASAVQWYECILEVTGSLHKHYYGYNYGNFHFEDLQNEISNLQERLQIDPARSEIVNIEIGVNLPTLFSPDTVITNLLTYKGNSFNRYRDKRIGKYCPLKSDFEIKAYNKGVQARLPGNILRFELHYTRMRAVNSAGVRLLSDLQNKAIVYSLISLLSAVWGNILIYPVLAESSEQLTVSEKQFLLRCRAPEYWQELYSKISRVAVKKQRDRIREIDTKYGGNVHEKVAGLITETWERLFTERLTNAASEQKEKADIRLTNVTGEYEVKAETGLTFVPNEKTDKVNVCTIKIKGTNVNLNTTDNKSRLPVCKTCGTPLHPKQRKGSMFCSEKFTSKKAAKKCRNKDSNKRNVEKKRATRA